VVTRTVGGPLRQWFGLVGVLKNNVGIWLQQPTYVVKVACNDISIEVHETAEGKNEIDATIWHTGKIIAIVFDERDVPAAEILLQLVQQLLVIVNSVNTLGAEHVARPASPTWSYLYDGRACGT